MDYSSRLGLGFLNYYNSHKELILNENFQRLDKLVLNNCLISRSLKEPKFSLHDYDKEYAEDDKQHDKQHLHSYDSTEFTDFTEFAQNSQNANNANFSKNIKEKEKLSKHQILQTHLYSLYIVPEKAIEPLWNHQIGKIAMLDNEGWRFFEPTEGMMFWIVDEASLIVYSNNQWLNLLSAKSTNFNKDDIIVNDLNHKNKTSENQISHGVNSNQRHDL